MNFDSNCTDFLKAIADDTRLRVVQQLMTGAKHVKAINSTLQVEQSLLSHHLKILKDAGIVESVRDGKSVLYRLHPDVHAIHQEAGLDFGCCQIEFSAPEPK